MGVYSTREEIVKAAIQKISSVPTSASSSFVSPEETSYLAILDEIIAADMEETVYPFAVNYMRLENPLIDPVLNPDNNKLLYTIPSYALNIGVFDENSLPELSDIVVDSSSARSLSYNYSFFGPDKLILSADPNEAGKIYYFVHTSLSPPIYRMFTSYQRYLVFELAYENYFKVGTNSRFLESLRLQALRKKSVAKRLCIANYLDFNKNLTTLNQILERGNPDGSV